MKKMTLLAATLAIVCCFSSCSEKEGVYNPKKKISAIYISNSENYNYYDGENWVTESHNTPKTIAEKWNWDGKLLKSVVEYETEYPDHNQVISIPCDTINYEYDGKQLTKIYNSEYQYDIVYDDNKVKEINVFSGGISQGKITVTHDGDKITRMDIVDYSGNDIVVKSMKKYDNARIALYRALIPNMELAKGMQRFEKKVSKGTVEQTSLTYTLEWDGDNVSKYTIKQASIEVASIVFEYDNKNNPYYNFLGQFLAGDNGAPSDGLSENNVTKATYHYVLDKNTVPTFTEDFTYTYDGKWPTVKTSTNSESGEYYSSTYTSTLYYEY